MMVASKVGIFFMAIGERCVELMFRELLIEHAEIPFETHITFRQRKRLNFEFEFL